MIAPGRSLWRHLRVPYLIARDGASFGIDKVLGIRTTEPAQKLHTDPELFLHRPCGWSILYRAFRRLRPGPEDVLVDIGSGSGRAVFVASLFPFRRVIGVEKQVTLHRQAAANLAAARITPRAKVEFVHGDALRFSLPSDTTVVFLYNPFEGQVFERLIDRIIGFVDRTPRRLRLVYVNPKEHRLLLATGRCVLTDRLRWPRPTRQWAATLTTHVYDLEPVAAAVERNHGQLALSSQRGSSSIPS